MVLIFCLYNFRTAQYLHFIQYMPHMLTICYTRTHAQYTKKATWQRVEIKFPHPLDQSIYLNSGFKSPSSVFS